MNESEVTELSPGEQVGDYRVKRLLGRGGFGEVYLAENVHLAENVGSRAEVAVKVFRPSEANVRLATSSREGEGLQVLRERFLHEAQTLQDMRRDAAVVDVGHVGVLATGEPYYVMPYHPVSLADRLGKDVFERAAQAELPEAERPRALGYDEGVRVLGQVLEGLAAAHGRGIVHRDVKPSNVLLDGKGNACVADFGIAKVPDSGLTASGMGLGSRLYMAPEQRESARHVDARADVYSFGRLAYRVLTGRLPDGRYKDPMDHAPAMGKALNDVILECLQEPSEERPATAAAVLKQWRAGLASTEGAAADAEEGRTVSGPLPPAGATEQTLLRDKIVEALLSRGDVVHVRDDLETLARAAGVDQGELDGLIEQIRLEHRRSVDAVRALRTAVDHELSRSEGEMSERGRELLLKVARAGNLEERLDEIVAWRQEAYGLRQKSNAGADSARPRPSGGEDEASEDETGRAADAQSRQPGTKKGWLAAAAAIAAGIALYFAWMHLVPPAAAHGTLTLELSPPDAEATLPGVEGGYVPGMRLDEGSYRVQASREGYAPATREVEVRAGAETRERIELSRLVWAFTVQPEPPQARVRILNVREPYRAGMELPAGSYRVEASASGYGTRTETVTHRGGPTVHRLTLAEQTWAFTVQLTPSDARVRILNIREPYRAGMKLPAGSYEVEASASGYETRTETVAHGGGPTVHRLTLSERTWPFTVRTTPSGARVRILNVGEPYRAGMKLPAGSYEVEASASGYETRRETVAHGGEPTVHRLTLSEQTWAFTVRTTPSRAVVEILNIDRLYHAGMQLPAGSYEIEVSASGYETRTETVEHGGGRTRHRMTLQRTGPDSCRFADDGTCDEPVICERGTDTTDCSPTPQPQPTPPLWCCDVYTGLKVCPITETQGFPGAGCYCRGLRGEGVMCY